mgnify:CR=1 FL=1
MNDLEIFLILLTMVGLWTAMRCGRLSLIALALTAFFLSTQPATAGLSMPIHVAALGASDSSVTQGQDQFEESLKLDPTGGHYAGIEYSDKSVRRQPTDQEILTEIESHVPKSVVIAVSNGSVRLSGRASDRATAEGIVESVKEVSGVHEVAFDLGLDDKDTETVQTP